MTSLLRTSPTQDTEIESANKAARLAGVLFIITFITSIPALLLYGPVLDNPDYILGAGADGRIQLGAFLEILLAIANIGTAVVLFPIVKRYSEGMALGYVAARILEGTVIVIGLISLLSVVTLRQDLAGSSSADASALVNISRSLVAVHDWTFLLGPAFCAAFGTGLLMGYLMYRSGLMPRRVAMLGLIGGSFAFTTATLVLFGVYEQTSVQSFLMTVPEMVWELTLGIWLIVKGFNPAAIATKTVRHAPAELAAAA